MTRLVLALAFAAAAVVPAAAQASPACVFVPNGDGGPMYFCSDPSREDCLLYGWMGAEAGLGPVDCERPQW
jgi:hypothetical protein